MLPEQIRTFVRKPPAGARMLVIVTETTLGIGPVIAEWTREQLEAEDGTELVSNEVQSTCQEYADSEGTAVKFLFRWIGSASSGALSSRVHRAIPVPSAEAPPVAGAGGALSDVLVRELLGHIARQQRQLNEALPTITGSFRETLGVLTELLKESIKREASSAERAASAPVPSAPRELTPEEREESIQRARALEAFTGRLPNIIDLGISLAASKFLPADGGETKQ